MLFRRYGNSVESVQPRFDAHAISEISFRRDQVQSFGRDEFEERFAKVREDRIGGETEGAVQAEAETELIGVVESRLQELLDGLAEGELLLVENQPGVDHPKLKDRKEGMIVDGENRLYFRWRVDPPIRVGLYRRRDP